MAKGARRMWGRLTWEHYIGILGILIIVAIAVFAVVYREQLANLESYGYLSDFVISLLASATVIVPVPGLAVVFALGGILEYPWLVGIMLGLAEPIGELTGYMAGRGGRSVIKNANNRFYERIEGWMRRRGALFLIIFSAFPNPVFDAAGVAAGATRYPIWKYLLALWVGKTIKGMEVAYLGYLGLSIILG